MEEPLAVVIPKIPKPSKWYHNPWFVLLMISPIALGPFGLALLWKSPKFSKYTKWGLSILTLAWTAWLVIYITTVVIPAVTNETRQYLNSLNQF